MAALIAQGKIDAHYDADAHSYGVMPPELAELLLNSRLMLRAGHLEQIGELSNTAKHQPWNY